MHHYELTTLLERAVIWGEDPSPIEADVERLDREHEMALAAPPEDDGV